MLCTVLSLFYNNTMHIKLPFFIALKLLQVLSETVANAIQMVVGEEASKTVLFVKMMHHFFGCLNVKNFSTGKKITL